ncbi:MAG TPA: GTP-binding protein, partial [Phycisphaerales bacterium]|nr:GTP-binding protein [Phycisphaerales bacterium]
MPKNTWSLLTPPNMGAIAIIQIVGDVQPVLCKLTNRSTWKHGNLYLVDIDGIDEVLAVQIDDRLAQVMPHGGVHILRKLTERFEELDVVEIDEPQFPEAGDSIEAQMLAVLAVADSPLAVELLLSQPAKLLGASCSQTDATRSQTLNHLITPPKVVLLGSPNTGKSTLMNALTKQDTSIVHDLPGATRDAVGARINCGGLVLDLFDLPGFRDSEDAIEQEAISIAKNIAKEAT